MDKTKNFAAGPFMVESVSLIGTESISVSSGVPQGDVSSAVPFIIYTFKIPQDLVGKVFFHDISTYWNAIKEKDHVPP